MDIRTDFDWLSSSTAHRKQLFVAAKRVVETTGFTWSQFYRAVFNQVLADDYVDNFRAGRMSLHKCSLLHTWMKLNHPAIAADLERSLTAQEGGVPPLPRRVIRAVHMKLAPYMGAVNESAFARRLSEALLRGRA